MGPEVSAPAAPALRVQGLSKHFGGAKALDNVSLTVAPGEIHGLLGQNGSGKSTLIKVLAGLHSPEPGAHIEIGGRVVPVPMPAGAFQLYGLSFVHQHLALIPALTVTENLFAGQYATHNRGWITERREQHAASAVLEEYGIPLPVDAPVESLLPVERALLAIVRAMHDLRRELVPGSPQGGLLILDEPTPFLPKHDVDRLFTLMRNLVQQGASVVFVSHDVDEVLEITDRATILRDGHVVANIQTRETTKNELIEHIVGRKVSEIFRSVPSSRQDVVIAELQGVGGPRTRNVDFRLFQGEIVGLTGLVGSGYDEVPYLLYGVTPGRTGQLMLAGESYSLLKLNPARALSLRTVLIPGDRPTQGGVLDLSVLDNLSLPSLDQTWRGWKVNWAEQRRVGQRLAESYQVRPRDLDLDLGHLSGGNQQKVVLAKWLQTSPRLILLDEPTQGVDVGAREEVYAVIRQAAAQGAGVLCASSDHEQLAALCDRVLIFRNGELAHEVSSPLTKTEISRLCYVEGPPPQRNAS